MTEVTKIVSKEIVESTNMEYVSNAENDIEITKLLDKNILNQVLKKESKINGITTSVSEVKWKEENGNLYPSETWGGVKFTRLQKEVTKIDNTGVVLEQNNGKGISSVILMGYGNRFPVAGIGNITYDEVISNLEVSYEALQELETNELKIELLKLYSKMPNATFSLTFYDHNGNVVNEVDSRMQEVYYYYDSFNRLSYSTDNNGNKIKETEYHYKGD